MGLKGETNSGTTGSWAWSRGEPDSGYIGRWAWVISRWDWTVSSSDPIVFCILSPLRHWCHLKDRSQRPPFVTVKFQFCAGWLRLFLQVKCLRFVSTKFRIWRLESSSLEKNLVNWFEKFLFVWLTHTLNCFIRCLFTWVVHGWVSYIGYCQKFPFNLQSISRQRKPSSATGGQNEYYSCRPWVQERARFTASIWMCNAAIHSLKLKPWTFEFVYCILRSSITITWIFSIGSL